MAARLTVNSVLKSGTMQMPVIGLGTLQVMVDYPDGPTSPTKSSKVEAVVAKARASGLPPPKYNLTSLSQEKGLPRKETILRGLEIGYRHLDSAYAYENEEAIGQAIREWMDIGGLKREDFFITTKLPNIAMRQELVDEYLQRSLKNLQLDYVDLYLIQNPVGYKPGDVLYPRDKDGSIELDFQTDHAKIWQAMEKQVDKGCAKHIGLSNFSLRQVDRLMEKASIPPANIQAECHLYFQQQELRQWAKDNSVVFTAYAALGSPAMMNFFREARKNSEIKMKSPLDDPLVDRLSRVHKKTRAQILLRHLLQLGVVVIPKSSTTEHMVENINVFDFELSSQEMAELNALDQGEHGRKFSLVGFFKGYEKHPENPYPLDD
uniref:NADP-dependent oxidoreductase domain-containing protein n=1 Tax=Homalodisca liturata TaxID=320908 RepID=A0A1B6JNN9_9HEMI